MGSKVNVKLWIYASVAAFIVMSILEYLFSSMILPPLYPEMTNPAPQAESAMVTRMWVYLGRFIFSLAFAFIFTRGFEGKPGVGEGLRYGLWVGILVFVPYLFISLVTTSFSPGSIVARCVASVIEVMICGMIVNWIYRREIKSATA